MLSLKRALIGVLALTAPAAGHGQEKKITRECKAIAYGQRNFSIGQKTYSVHEPKYLMLQVSVSPRDTGGEPIIQVACKILNDFPHDNFVNVLIFDSLNAAKHLVTGLPESPDYEENLWHLRAHVIQTDDGGAVLRYWYPVLIKNSVKLDVVEVELRR